MPHFVTCGPNEAIVVSGCCHSNTTTLVGGRVLIWPLIHRVQRLSLNTFTLIVDSSDVYSEGGVPVTVKGVAQVKIQGKDLPALRAAAENFLDKTEDEIMDVARATIDGHQRSMIASMKIEDIYKHRDKFSKDVEQSALADLIEMGLTLVSFTVQDISDTEGYLEALGQCKTVDVKSEARREVAQANYISNSRKIDIEHKKREKDITNEQIIALKQLEFESLKEKALKEHYENKARSEKAGDLQLAEMNRKIAQEELNVLLLEKQKEKELVMKRKRLKELELAQVRDKADLECEREKSLALAHQERTKAEARIEADKIEALARARAEIISSEKEADAEVLKHRGEAFKTYGNAAKLEMVLAILPRLTAEIAGPIADCKKITSVSQDGSVGFSRVTSEILEVVEQLCNSIGGISIGTVAGDDTDNNNNNTRSGPSNPRQSPTESVASSRFESRSIFKR